MSHEPREDQAPNINPATGLPMLEEGGVDVAGNPYGANIQQPVWVPEPPSYDDWQPSWDEF